VGGNVLCYVELARALGRERPFYGVEAPGPRDREAPSTIEAMAAAYNAEIQRVQPEGPYLLGGWSMGGVVAFEMARQLERRGAKVAHVALIDARLPSEERRKEGADEDLPLYTRFAMDLGGVSRGDLTSLLCGAERQRAEEQLAELVERSKQIGILPPDISLGEVKALVDVFERNFLALERWSPRPAALPVTLLRAGPAEDPRDDAVGWRRYAPSGVTVREIPGDHYSVLKQPHVRALSEELKACLDEAAPPPKNSTDHR
jgi:thioesterase domain-containing protein